MLWSADAGASIFDSVYEKKKPKKNQKYLIFEEKQKVEQGFNEIWTVITHDEKKKQILRNLQPFLIEFKKRIQASIHNFLYAKNQLVTEIGLLSNLIDTEILGKFLAEDVTKALLWIESKKHEKELSIESVFELQNQSSEFIK